MSSVSTTWEISDSDAEVEKESKGHLASRERSRDSGERSASVPPPSFERHRPRPAKRRRSKEETEETEADRDEAGRGREARENNRAAKERRKREKRMEQEKRKEAAQRLEPENWLRCLTVCVDPALLRRPGCDVLLGTLSSFQWRYSIRQQPLANSITWTRDFPQLADGAAGTLAEEEEDQLVQVLSASQFVDVVVAVKKLIDSDGEQLEGDSVPGPLPEGFPQDAAKVATLLVTEYRRPAFAETVRSRSGGGKADVEEVLVFLQLRKNVAVFFVESWQDVTDHVCAVTKSLSKRPLKRLTERAELPFCAEGSWAGGARVEKDGSGLRRVWSEQIRQLNRVGGATASCVTAAYPSPRLLLQAYGASRSEEERKKLLAHLAVKGDGKDQRVGPEISTRVYRCLTAQNPELVLD